jgi:hypothetical protein
MYRWFRLPLALVVALVMGQGIAAASTATVSPGGAVTGTTGAVQWTLNTAAKTLNCTTAGFTATLASATGTLPLTIATNLTWLFGSAFGGGRCTVTGGVGYTSSCGAATFKATAVTTGSVTPLSMTGISCAESLAGSSCRVVITGGVTASFDNATSRLTLNTTGQTLVASGSTCTTLPNDTSVSLTDSTRSALVYAITPSTTINVT